jgi:GNAT superfamily N-acetyltransferase
MPYSILPLTRDRWDNLAALFRHAPASGCWCMYFRLTREEFGRNMRDSGGGAANRAALRALVGGGHVPGLLAYDQGVAVGWCSVAPRSEYAYLQQSRTLYPVDDQPVWSIVCFFVHPRHRGWGVAAALLQAAVSYAAARGARIIEGYPSDPARGKGGRLAEISAYTGVIPMFEAAGFRKVAQRRKGGRTIMRLVLGEERATCE